MYAKILDVFERDCHLVVRVEHYHPDGSLWFTEDYVWQGREGLKRKRLTDADGMILMDNRERAPTRPGVRAKDGEVQYLPEGREWLRATVPHMDDGSVLDTIKAVHARRTATGWDVPDGTLQGAMMPNDKDRDGCGELVAHFQHLAGREL